MSADEIGAVCAAGNRESDPGDFKIRDPVDHANIEGSKTTKENVKKPKRKVCFPEDDQLVTQYVEPENPWQDVPVTVPPLTKSQLVAEYLECCRKHETSPLDCVLQQIRDLPENAIGGATRAPRLTISECALVGSTPADALEVLFKRVQFRKIELQAAIDDAAIDAIFDMVEYYESATALVLNGPRHFGIRGWQAASRMLKKSSQLSELEVSNHPLEPKHAVVLARAIYTHTCTLRCLVLQRALLSGDSTLSLVKALKTNSSLRELRLGDNGLTAQDAAQIASLLRFNTRLQLLDLSNNQIQDTGAGHIAEALASQSLITSPTSNTSPLSPHGPVADYETRGLAFLVLWNNQLTRNCANHLSKALLSQSLCVLNVGRNAVGSDAVRALAAGGALVSLGLQCARLGPDCARALHELVKADTRLQRLDLRDNRLGDAGLQAILTALKENKTLTQIDLDEPHESTTTLTAEDSEHVTVARLTREIQALCRKNEPEQSPEKRAHRKISLTCSTVHINRMCQMSEEERRGRLRSPLPSPAPSPAGSPVPHQATTSRFSVTRVTPDRQTPGSIPATPIRTTHSPTSRFKVVQVAEPPQIHIHTPEPSRKPNRFSVTRNYDIAFNMPSPGPRSMPNTGIIGTFDLYNTTGVTPPRLHVDPLDDSENSGSPSSGNETLPFKNDDKCEDTKSGTVSSLVKSSESGKEDCARKVGTGSTDHRSANASGASVVIPSGSDENPDKCGKSDLNSDNNEKTVDNKCNVSDVNITISELSNSNVTKDACVHNVDIVSVNVKNVNVIDDSCVNIVIEAKTDTQISDCDNNRENNVSISPSKVDNLDNKMLQIGLDHEKKSAVVTEIEKLEAQVAIALKSGSVNNSTKVHSEQKNESNLGTNKNLNKQTKEKENIDDIAMRIGAITKEQGQCIDSNKELTTEMVVHKDDVAMKQIEAITEDLGHLIQEMKDLSTKTAGLTKKDVNVKFKSENTQTDVVCIEDVKSSVKFECDVKSTDNVLMKNLNETLTQNVSVVLKKNKSESSLDSPDLEVSRLMNKKIVSPFCDSSSSLEISGSSMESLDLIVQNSSRQRLIPFVPSPLTIQESTESELDRRKIGQFSMSEGIIMSTESSIESSQETPNTNFINMSLSSNESVSPIIFSAKKNHGSLSSLEASLSSVDSRQEKMATSADSGIEHSVQCPAGKYDSEETLTLTYTSEYQDVKTVERFLQNTEGSLTQNLERQEVNKQGFKHTDETITQSSEYPQSVKKVEDFLQDTPTQSPKRTSSLLDVPALKNKSLDRMRKISWVAPSSSNVPKTEPEKETKLPSHLEKLLSLFQHPTSLFSRNQNEEDKKCNTPPRKDSTLTSSFWSWGSSSEKEKDTEVAEVKLVEEKSVVRETRVMATNSSESQPIRQDIVQTTLEVAQTSSDMVQRSLDLAQISSESTNSGLATVCSIKDQNVTLGETLLKSIKYKDMSPENSISNNQIDSENPDAGQKYSKMTESSREDSKTSQETSSVGGDDSSSTDSISTTSERAQIAFIDESFSKKLDSKASSTDTENTLNEYQTAQISSDSSQDKSEDINIASGSKTVVLDVPKECLNSSVTELSEAEVTSKDDNINTTDIEHICSTVQSLVLSDDSSNGNKLLGESDQRACDSNKLLGGACDSTDLNQPNDLNRNYETHDIFKEHCDKIATKTTETRENENNTLNKSHDNTMEEHELEKNKPCFEKCHTTSDFDSTTTTNLEKYDQFTFSDIDIACSNADTACSNTKNIEQMSVLLQEKSDLYKNEDLKEPTKSRSFASVLKASGSGNTLEKQLSPDNQPVDKLPSKVIKGIKENISPENTLTSSMTKTLALELGRQVNIEPVVNYLWDLTHEGQNSVDTSFITEDLESDSKKDKQKAPIATIDETCEDIFKPECSRNTDDIRFIDEKPECDDRIQEKEATAQEKLDIDSVDLGKDALCYLIYDNQDFDPETEANVSHVKTQESSLAQELKDAENKQKLIDLSPELILEDLEDTDVFNPSLVPERAIVKKANSLGDLLTDKSREIPKTKTIAFKIPETSTSTSPRDIPRKEKLRSRSGSSPKSLPECLSKSCPLTKLDCKKKKKVSSLGKMAKDSLLALNMTDEEIAEFRKSYKLTSVESLRSLESVSEDANSQSGTSDSRCRACIRTSQESLMSLDSISEDCRCSDSDKGDKLSRSAR